jgi:hypothetical protein
MIHIENFCSFRREILSINFILSLLHGAMKRRKKKKKWRGGRKEKVDKNENCLHSKSSITHKQARAAEAAIATKLFKKELSRDGDERNRHLNIWRMEEREREREIFYDNLKRGINFVPLSSFAKLAAC